MEAPSKSGGILSVWDWIPQALGVGHGWKPEVPVFSECLAHKSEGWKA